MRWFWLFILFLVLLTCGLYMNRVRTNAAIEEQRAAAQEQQSQRSTRPRRNRESKPDPKPESQPEPKPEAKPEPKPNSKLDSKPVESSDSIQEPIGQSSSDTPNEQVELVDSNDSAKDELVDDESSAIDETDETVQPEPELDLEQDSAQENQKESIDDVQGELGVGDLENETIDQPTNDAQPDPTSTQEVPNEPDIVIDIEEQAPVELGPTYTMNDDGSFTVISTSTTITGQGTRENPYELDWTTLRSIERVYDPKEDKTDLPDWLDLLNEKYIKITGNTLVPVIATTTRELLVMQNPWDGCCIGIPPSPYDAIEVTLNHDVDFGSSAVGYGTVEGIFVLDPYVVDLMGLGLYLVEDATYRSGEGIAFPDF